MANEYDERQLLLMRKQIEGFEEGALTLADLVLRLEALLCFLPHVEPEWRKRFDTEWINLEICNASQLSNGVLSEHDRAAVTRHIANLKDLLAQVP